MPNLITMNDSFLKQFFAKISESITLIVTILLLTSGGLIGYKILQPNYLSTTLTLTSNAIPIDLIAETITENNSLLNQGDYESVAINMNSKEETVKLIKEIEFNGLIGNFTKYNSIYVKPYQIAIKYTDTGHLQLIKETIFSFLNKLVKREKVFDLENKKRQLANAKNYKNKTDSLLKNMDISNPNYAVMAEFNYNLGKELSSLNTTIDFSNEAYQVVSEFTDNNSKSMKQLLLFGAIGLVIGLGINFIWLFGLVIFRSL